MQTAVEEVLFENGKAVGVRARAAGGESYELRCQVVVDASGRATVIGTQLGLKEPVPGLDKASMSAYYRGGNRRQGLGAGETTVYAIADGSGTSPFPTTS